MAYVLETCLSIATMLFFGSLNTVLLKVQLTLPSVGVEGNLKTFKKPWFETLTMFMSMVLSLILVAAKTCRERRQSALKESLVDTSDSPGIGNGAGQATKISYGAKVRLVVIPAMFDLIGIGIALTGLLLVPASIWQILRGAEIIFAEIISVLVLKGKSYAYKWLSVAICVVGIAVVGAGSVLGSKHKAKDDENSEPTELLILGIGLVLFSQIIQAGQMVGEEYLMKEVDLEAMEVIGYEGMWGSLVMLIVVVPVLYFWPGGDAGSQENIIDTVTMMSNSSQLLLAWCLLFASCLIYNLSGIMITSYLSAVHRVIIEAMRTLVVWTFALIVYYYVDETAGFAEPLTPYSWMEALGFCIVFVGQVIYGALVKVPGFTYAPPTPKAMPTPLKSPSAMKSPLYALGHYD